MDLFGHDDTYARVAKSIRSPYLS